jgi:hypothetical protein
MWRKTVSEERVSKIGDLSSYFEYTFDGRGNTSEQKHHMNFFNVIYSHVDQASHKRLSSSYENSCAMRTTN